MSNVSQWETSAPNNDAAPPDGAPEGMAANTVNDTMREMMAATARWYQDINGSLVTGGAGNAYTLTTNNNNSSLTDLPLVVFVANRANSGAATLNVDGLGAKSLRFGGVALAAGVIQEDVAYIAIYNAEDDAFDIVGYPTKDASEITTGELDDDRLSDNVPLKDAVNVFTGIRQTIQSERPSLHFTETDASTDEGRWELAASNQFVLNTLADGGQFGANAFRVLRSGTAITELEVNAPLLDINGNADISGTLDVGGNATASRMIASAASPELLLRETDAAADNQWWSFTANGEQLRGVVYNDVFAGNNWLVVDRTGNTVDAIVLSATGIRLSGAVRAGTAATSTSTTLAAGQVHAVNGNATLPNMAAGQWVTVINNSASPITVTKNASDTMYWTAAGSSVTSVTIPARGRASFVCADGTNVYASGNITGSS